jgi:hypothetical protein
MSLTKDTARDQEIERLKGLVKEGRELLLSVLEPESKGNAALGRRVLAFDQEARAVLEGEQA